MFKGLEKGKRYVRGGFSILWENFGGNCVLEVKEKGVLRRGE